MSEVYRHFKIYFIVFYWRLYVPEVQLLARFALTCALANGSTADIISESS